MKIGGYKGFLTAKKGLPIEFCADSIACNPDLTRLAIADGVTNSYFPEFVSRGITDSFIKSDVSAHDFFLPECFVKTLNDIISDWDSKAIQKEQEATPGMKSVYDTRRHNTPFGATTFCGVSIENGNIDIVSLGDSCVFFIPADKSHSPQLFTSMPFSIDEDGTSPAWFKCDFGNHPHFIDTEGRMVGKPLQGSIPLEPGVLMLMTDALSQWFINHFTHEDGEDALNVLLYLNSEADFLSFVEKERETDNEELHDDDTALLMVTISDEETEQEQDLIVSEHTQNEEIHEEVNQEEQGCFESLFTRLDYIGETDWLND